MFALSIEIFEEVGGRPEQKFLPVCTEAVRQICRNPIVFITYTVFLLASSALCALDFVLGAFFLPVSIIMLIASTVMLKKSKNGYGTYGLKFQTVACLISAVIIFVLTVLSEIDYTDELLRKVSRFGDGFVRVLPKPFCEIVNHGFLRIGAIAIPLAAGFLLMDWVFGSQNRSRRKNLPSCKVPFLSFLVHLLLFAWLIYDGLGRLHLVPSYCNYEDWTFGVKLSRYTDAALCFAFALFLLLQAVCCLIVYIKMRKVRKCCFQANRNMNI